MRVQARQAERVALQETRRDSGMALGSQAGEGDEHEWWRVIIID
jgi:hypothetical protein